MYDIAKQWISEEAATKYFNCSRATPSSLDLPLEDLLDVNTISVGQVRFSPVLSPYLLNPKPDPQFSSGDLPEPRTEPTVLVLFGPVQVQEVVERRTERGR
jgi:hypothetical protein